MLQASKPTVCSYTTSLLNVQNAISLNLAPEISSTGDLSPLSLKAVVQQGIASAVVTAWLGAG